MKAVIILLASAAMLCGCSTGYQARKQSGSTSQKPDSEIARPYGNTTKAKNITSLKGYQPTEDDVIRYNNDVRSFLEGSVPNFNKYKGAMIVIDDVKSESLNEVSLSEIRFISVLDSSTAPVLGSSAYYGAIIIKTR